MRLKQAIGLVFHKLLDWRIGFNPITDKLYPELYNFKLLSLRKKTTMIVFTIPSLDLLTTAPMQSYGCLFPSFVFNYKVVEGNNDDSI